MKAIPVFLILALAMSTAPAKRGRGQTPTKKPACNDLCTFIVNVMKEEPTGFAALKGEALKDRIDPTWVGTYDFSGAFACTNTFWSQEQQYHYECILRADMKTDEGMKKYNELVQALKSAFPEGWTFTSEHYAANLAKGLLAPGNYTSALQTSTRAEAIVQIELGSPEDDPNADVYVELKFVQRPPAASPTPAK